MKINIIKQADCGKVSQPDTPTLTYNIGYVPDDESFHIRVITNTGGGFFSVEWISLDDILSCVENRETFNANIFASLFKSKSANNSGFLAAALKAEKLLLPYKETKRLHTFGDVAAFKQSMQKHLKKDLPDVVAEREAAKEAKQKALAEELLKRQASKNTK
ncbi:hypothetical protein [Thalassotalea aquiviva]|uniref:hypothetical protein n=1 Tax=Thalassotalea aquiviva TaxID=3242415 RepID=UPI00352A44A7